MKADEVYAKLKKMIGLVSVGMKNTTSTQNPDGSVTITINFTSGSPLSFTIAPVKGDKGVGIKDAQIKEIQNGENTEYHLILIDDKDNNIDAGNIPISSVGSYPDTTNLATKSDLTTHTSDTNIHITSAERNKWNNKAEISDIPNLTNYATKTYVTDEIAKSATGGTVDLSGYAKTVDVNSALSNKVDKVDGKSLVSDTEIERLKNVDNYDDTSIKNTLNNKANTTDLTTHTSDTNIHITTAERNKWNAVDDKIGALKSAQSIEYGGTDVICNNTLASRTSDMFIKGKTYLNLGTGGLESAGENENKISILSYNKNLVNPNKLFLNNSSIIKENGAFICPSNVSWKTEKIMGVDLSKPLYFAYEIKSDENIIIDKTNQNMLIRLDYVKTGANIEATNIPIGAKITNEYTKFIFKNISLSNTDIEQGINLVFRNGVGKKMYIRNITISNAPIDDVIPYQQDKKEILSPIDGGLKSLPNEVADTIEQRNDGVYLVQRVKKMPLYGSVSFNYPQEQNSTNTVLVYFTNTHDAIPNTNNILCNTIKSCDEVYDIWSSSFDEEGVILNYKADLLIRINKSRLNTVDYDGIKKFINDNQLTVYYALKTPIETKLDINDLDLEVYKDVTYVTTENAIQPTLSFKVPYNIGGVIQGNAQNINKLYEYKVDKIDGKGLSSNDYTAEEKTKVGKIVTNGNGTTFLANDGTYKKVSSSTSAVAERKFKPVFGFDTYWGEMRDTHGNKNQVELVRIKEQIDQCEAMKVDKIICTVHIGWDETTNSLVIAENTDSLLSAISYCADKNVTIDTVKVHVHFKGSSKSEQDYVNDVIGMSTFQSKYKPMLTTICNLFKNTTVTRIIILNEMWYITNANLGYSSFVNECLNIVKSAGYTTGLSMAGFNTNLKLSDAVIENLDTFYINVYPGISGSGKYITKLEAIEAFNQCDVDLWIVKLKKDYPNKKIVISEIGTNDYWESLACPSSWQVSGNSKTGGYAVDTYITAMMEFFINKNVEIEELWWWYDLYYEPVKETLLNYLGGDR